MPLVVLHDLVLDLLTQQLRLSQFHGVCPLSICLAELLVNVCLGLNRPYNHASCFNATALMLLLLALGEVTRLMVPPLRPL